MEIKPEEHIGLVAMIARPYAAATRSVLMDSEQFADGCVGLMKAVEAYDRTLGFEFSTFASKCIRTAIHDGIKKRRRERRYKDGSVVRMHVSSESAELSQVDDETVLDAMKSEDESRLYAAIESLPERQQCVIRLRLEGYGFQEVGEILGYSKQRAEQVEKIARRAIGELLTGKK